MFVVRDWLMGNRQVSSRRLLRETFSAATADDKETRVTRVAERITRLLSAALRRLAFSLYAPAPCWSPSTRVTSKTKDP